MPQSLLRYTNILSIVGDLIRVHVPDLTQGNAPGQLTATWP